MEDNKIKNWVKREIYINHLFLFDYVGLLFHRSTDLVDLDRKYKSYLLEWVFENIAEGFDEIITKPPLFNEDSWDSWLEKCKVLYKNTIFPLYRRRKNSLTFHYGETMAFIDMHDLDITSKSFGASDNFKDDSSPELDRIYNF